MEEIACNNGEAMQERVVRQPFVKSPLREGFHCSETDSIYFGASVTAAVASRRRQVQSGAQRPPDGAVTATTFKTPTDATITGSVAVVESANTLPLNENPKPAELFAAPQEIVCGKLPGSTTDVSGFEHKREGRVAESDTASQAYFDIGSQHSTDTDATSVSTSSTSVDGGQQMSENLTAATLALGCAFAAELDLPGLVEPRSPLSTIKCTRLPARQVSSASFRSKMRKVSLGDRRTPGSQSTVKAVKAMKDFFRRKQNILR
jgi:hypothetical protein